MEIYAKLHGSEKKAELKEILFASSNQHKVEEVREMLPSSFNLIGLHDIKWIMDIPEPYDTFEENALAKVSFVFEQTGLPCFSDDSGLMIDSLHGRPGVWSARYAGKNLSSEENITKVLEELDTVKNRTARFVAVIAFKPNLHESYVFKGTVEGSISLQPEGNKGFGYDPVFIPAGFNKTFGQLSPSIKKNISHRAKAMDQFIRFINEYASK